MTTMKEIAQAAGVSVSSVSLVLNGRDSGRINPQLANRIRETAERMGYQPMCWPAPYAPTGRI
ncbi:LacI family transcriptional regulator [Bifidobacterium animalis subsp. lactis]|nr:LacI family transcriptional regulator [Bifidobacterium animalis subsp. lactis]